MKHVVMTAAAIALCGVGATAQTAEFGRSDQSVGILFEPGNYARFSLGGFNPNVSGVDTTPSKDHHKELLGDISPGYGIYSLGYKQALNDRLDLAIIIDQPIGAKAAYADDGKYYQRGSTARIDSAAVTGLLRYKLPHNLSVYGGLRIERASFKFYEPFMQYVQQVMRKPYTLDTSRETDLGYVVGLAWEKPESGARVALTYNSKIDHAFLATEWGKAPTQLKKLLIRPSIKVTSDTFTTTTPESVNLEFQTGIAGDTLLMGSVRWVHWTQFDITPPAYSRSFTMTGEWRKAIPLINYTRNSTTLNIGVDHRFNDQWSGVVIFGYEPHKGQRADKFNPTDGFKSATLAASYQASDKIKITAGISYVDIGDAVTGTYTTFSGNYGWGGGVRVGIRF